MTKQKAFWLTLATVGIPSVLIWGTLLYVTGWRMDEWSLYALVIVATVILFSPFVYRSYLNRSIQKPTRDDYLKRAIISGCLTVAYLVLDLMHPQYGRGSLANWMMPALWFLGTVYNLIRASKAEKTSYVPHEY
jgi:hypothetical protein